MVHQASASSLLEMTNVRRRSSTSERVSKIKLHIQIHYLI